MSGIYRWSMRHGAAILFGVALIQFLVALAPLISVLISETGQMAANYSYAPAYSGIPSSLHFQMLFQAIVSAALPFFGALLIDRLDRWIPVRDPEVTE